MKRKILLLITVLALALGLFACKPTGGDGGGNDNIPNPPSGTNENLIYNSTTDISLIFVGDEVTDETATAVYNRLFPFVHSEYLHIYIDEIPEKAEHEIIVGRTDREISKRAYTYLERENYNGLGDCGYIIYSDGSSVAIAYTEALNYSFINDVVLDFADEYFSEELVLKKGIVKQEKLNLMSIFEEEDQAKQDLQWARLEEKAGTEVMEAMKQLYKLYKPDVVDWLANLYEHRICVCTTVDENGNKVCQHPTDENGNPLCYNGGFYYSNSGRNTEGFLPDIESTNQALSFLESSGMLSSLGGRYSANLPTWMKNEIVAFVKGLQRPNGYFYHPQWSIELTDSRLDRRGRDLDWAQSMLKNLGATPYYDTPGGMKGSGKPETSLTGMLMNTSPATSVSALVEVSSAYPAHLETPKTFKDYLDSLDLAHKSSYSIGNTIAAQVTQIKARDVALGGTAFEDTLFAWYDEHQNSINGMWDTDLDYEALDGYFKILTTYDSYKRPVKYAMQAAMTTLDVIMADEPVYTVCNMYNAWYNIGGIKKNLTQYSPDKQLAAEQVAAINEKLWEIAPNAIIKTAERTANFAIPDGSFSYLIGHSSETSQGMPVATLYAYEGDINATLICIGGLIGHINNALDTPKVNTHGLADWYRFVDIVEENTPSIKGGMTSGGRYDFESDELDVPPENTTVSISSTDGAIAVKQDPYSKKDNKVLNIYHPYEPGKGDYIKFNNLMSALGRNCSVFESDFLVTSEGTDNTYVAQFSFDNAYYFTFRLANGMLGIWEDSSTELVRSKARHLVDVELDEWFKIKIEYYYGSHDTVRIKFYVNEKLVAVSANYGDYAGNAIKKESGTPMASFNNLHINPLSYVDLNMYMDNVLLTSINQEYVSEAETQGLVVNADMPSQDRVTHTFDGDSLPEGFEIISGGSNVSVSDGKLNFAKDSQKTVLTVQRHMREALPNCFAVGFDVDFTDASDGEILSFAFTEPQHFENKIIDITNHEVRCVTEGGVKYLIVTSKGGSLAFESTKIKIDDEPTSFEFVYFTKQKQTLVYVNGTFIGLSDYYIPSNPHQYEFGYLTLTYSGKMAGSLDNLFVESRKADYTDETTPDVDRVIYDFAVGVHKDLTTDGTVDSGRLELKKDQTLTIPINNRVDTPFSAQLELDLDLGKLTSDGYTRIELLDTAGDAVFAIELSYYGGVLSIYEVSSLGRLATPIVSLSTNKSVKLTIDCYPNSPIATVKLDGVYVLATSVFCSDSFDSIASARITSSGSYVDNIYFDGLIFAYIPVTITGENKDNTDEVITYEYSSSGNLPARVTPTLIAGGANSEIKVMMKKLELTKVYSFTTAAGGNDYVDFLYKSDKKTNKLVFETDINVGINGYFEIHVLNGSSSSNAGYRAILRTGSGNLYFYDTSGANNQTPGPEKVIAKANEWVSFKMEIDLGNGIAGSAKFNTYVDGVLVYTSQNFYGAYNSTVPKHASLDRIRFYTWGSTTGSIAFDNTSIRAGECLHAGLVKDVMINAPTCSEGGEQKFVCATPDCDFSTVKSIPAAGHSMGEWIADEADPTVETRKCKNCDHTETRAVEIPEEPVLPPETGDDDKDEDDDFMDGDGWATVGIAN